MSVQRRERERAQRHRLIISAARDIAEAEGWEAVTTRRLAERVEYSQPVLYSHFAGKDAIVAAVAIEGFADLAAALRDARTATSGPKKALRAVCRAYLAFAATRPALYDAMFVMPTSVRFASEETPPALRAAFGEFVAALAPFGAQPELSAELVWSTLHGMVVLTRSGRIPPAEEEARLDLIVRRIAAG